MQFLEAVYIDSKAHLRAMPDLRVELCPIVIDETHNLRLEMSNVQQVEGVHFWKVCKGDHVLARLVCGKSHRKEKAFTNTNFVEQLVSSRNKVVTRLQLPQAVEDLGLDEEPAPKKQKAVDADLPAFVLFVAPTIGTVAGVPLRALCGVLREPLWLELTDIAVQYVVAALRYQLSEDGMQDRTPAAPTPERLHSDTKGVTYDISRKAFRARHAGQTKYFRVAVHDDAEAAATQWLQALQE